MAINSTNFESLEMITLRPAMQARSQGGFPLPGNPLDPARGHPWATKISMESRLRAPWLCPCHDVILIVAGHRTISRDNLSDVKGV